MNEKILKALVDVVLAEDSAEFAGAKEALRQYAKDPNCFNRSAEYRLRQIFLDIGSPDHLLGHEYLIKAILMAHEDFTWINNLTSGFYPKLAVIFDTTPSRVERAIRHTIETIFDRGSLDDLYRYFGNTVDPNKGRPTNGEFIARMANVLRMECDAA